MCGGPTAWRDPGAEQPPIDLDHIGIATDEVARGLRELAGGLGATVIYGGHAPGCRYIVSRVGDAGAGMDLELLEPHPDGEQFLPAFLARRGCGPHHLSFLVRDLDPLLERVRAAGIEPAVQRTEDPLWREVFVRSADAAGIVVQLAQTTGGLRSDDAFAAARAEEWRGAAATQRQAWTNETGSWWEWPGPRAAETAFLVRVAFAARDLDRVERFYGDLLGGEVVERTAARLELRWPRGGTLRFAHAPDAREGVAQLELDRLPAGRDELEGARLVAAGEGA
ncbi:MAG: hypothetical protein GXY03_09190 [Solirubrobacterales bacterium]|nr:hypothetical protein [Solirubrobacterales bacterium]